MCVCILDNLIWTEWWEEKMERENDEEESVLYRAYEIDLFFRFDIQSDSEEFFKELVYVCLFSSSSFID